MGKDFWKSNYSYVNGKLSVGVQRRGKDTDRIKIEMFTPT